MFSYCKSNLKNWKEIVDMLIMEQKLKMWIIKNFVKKLTVINSVLIMPTILCRNNPVIITEKC